jgi:signal transduction histidine kinase
MRMQEGSTILGAEPPRLTEDQLLEAARLLAVGEMAGEVAHELNNPLFAILGLVELMLKSAEPGSKLEHRLALVQQTGIEMKQIVRGLADFARDDSQEIAVVRLGDIVDRAIVLTRLLSAAKDVEFVIRPAIEDLYVECGAVQLVSVVFDLITKARRALAAGGTVEIAVADDDGSASVHIAALGGRIEPVSLDSTVGLAVDLAVIQTYGGTLTHGPGSEFLVRLPLADEPGDR